MSEMKKQRGRPSGATGTKKKTNFSVSSYQIHRKQSLNIKVT